MTPTDAHDHATNPVDPKPVDGDREGITEALTRVVMDHAPGLHPIGDREAANIARAVLSALRQRGRLVEGDPCSACRSEWQITRSHSEYCSAYPGTEVRAPPSPGATGSEGRT